MSNFLQKLAKNDYQGAHADCITMINDNVNDPRPYYGLGILAFDHHNYIKASELHARAFELDPTNAAYAAASAQALSTLGRQNEARIAAESASLLVIKDPLTADIIGVVFSRAGFHERAVPFFKKAIAFNPKPANFHYNLGSSLQFSGQFEAAKLAYQATLARDKMFFKAFTALVALETQTVNNNQLDTLLKLFDQLGDNPDAQLHIGHALAKTYEDLNDYHKSLAWLHKAKERHKKQYPTDQTAQTALFKAAANTVHITLPVTKNTNESSPIFIVGLPRTGTTLVDRIISSHSDVIAAGELNVFAALIKQVAGTESHTVLDAATLSNLAAADFQQIGDDYINSTRALARNAKRFTDKMPLNFFYADLILKALPNARIVALRRGAMDSCLSNYRQLFSTQFSYYNYTYDLGSTASFYKEFDRLIIHWRASLPAHRFIEIHYEDIIYDQENQTRKLLDFCDLSWQSQCLHFHENTAAVSTASSVQVRQKLYNSSIDRWKRYGDALNDLQSDLKGY